MADEKSNRLGAILGILFTTILAPLLVFFLTEKLKSDNKEPPAPPPAAVKKSGKAKEKEVEIPANAVVVEGVGTSPEEADLDARRKALLRALESLMSAEALVKNDQLLAGKVFNNPDRFIKQSETLSTDKTGKKGKETYRKRLSVTVDRRALQAELKALAVKTDAKE